MIVIAPPPRLRPPGPPFQATTCLQRPRVRPSATAVRATGVSWQRAAADAYSPPMASQKRAVYLNADLHKALRAKSAAMDLTVAELVSKAARTYLADAADEATFGRQEPSLSFRAARAK